jgi:hypothetical protein
MKERNRKAVLNILFTVLITGVFYADIITDLYLCRKYYINGDIWWFRITLGIVALSSYLILWFFSNISIFKSLVFIGKRKNIQEL